MTTPFNSRTHAAFTHIRIVVLLSTFILGACTGGRDEAYITDDDIELNNRGVALMGRFDYHGAGEVFEQLVERHPQWHEVRTNFAIALKNRQQADDGDRAMQQLQIVLDAQPDNLRANYVAGVLQLYLGQIEPAANYFRAALAADPQDAYAHYYLGQCRLRSGDETGALASYQEAIMLDPYLRSAYYSAAQVLRRLGRDENANQMLALFQRFENNPSARLAEFKYTRMGPQSLAKVLGVEVETEAVAVIPDGPLFSEERVVARFDAAPANLHITSVDIDGSGSQDLFFAGNKKVTSRLLVATTDSTFEEKSDHPWAKIGSINAVAWGDIDNNGLVDAYLCRTGPNQLWMQMDSGKWRQSGAQAMVSDSENDCADAAMVDADHDGDLDILVANRGAADNLLNNNRDGTFRSLADKLLAAAQPADTRHLLTTDIDGDSDIDLVFVREAAPHVVLINDRQWNYVASSSHDDLLAASFVSLAAVDLNVDGQTELVTIDIDGEINVWQRGEGGQWRAKALYRSALSSEKPADLVPIDLSGNGRAELVLLSVGAFEVVSPTEGTAGDWKARQIVLEQYTGSTAVPIIRSTKGASLIALRETADGSDVVEWAPGTGRFDFATLTLSGKHDAAETMRSNASGIGSQVSIRNGSQWSLADTHKHSSLRGYSLQPLAIGLGGRSKADFVAVNWSDGVYQTELDVESGSIQQIAEEQRQLGSCPVLFAWNGQKFDFVTDILGVAAQGFLVEPGTLLPPRPWEYVAFAPGALGSEDGRVIFKVTEPMEENSYIDKMTLTGYDLPAEWAMIVDERMGTGEPVVTGKPLFFRESVMPARAFDGAGNDVHDRISEHDQQAMSPGDIDRRYLGLLKDMESLTLEFDESINTLAAKPDAYPVLVAESWVELPYSQTHFAAWQAGKSFRSVTLEARDAEGSWHTVYPDFGIPAGMPRVMSLPMLDLPAGTTALRLGWNREIYWDRVRVVWAETPPTEMQSATVTPELARVAKSGFYTRKNHAQRRPEYIYQQRKPFGDVKYPTGFYTSLGEMTELISSADDALAIIGPGEEIHVEFEPPALPAPDLHRWYVLETRGWAKDKDMYTYQGDTVAPLPRAYPGVADGARESLHQKYNTRFQSGR